MDKNKPNVDILEIVVVTAGWIGYACWANGLMLKTKTKENQEEENEQSSGTTY